MKKILTLLYLMSLVLLLFGCQSNPNDDYCVKTDEPGVYICEKRTSTYFDTIVSLKVYHTADDDYDLDAVFDYFTTTLETYHQYFDKYNAYDGVNNIYTINQAEGPVVLDEVLFNAIQYALDNEDLITYQDVPMFNIALNPVLNVWHDARESALCDLTREIDISYCPVPRDEIDDVVFNTDPNDIIMNRDQLSIAFAKEAMGIDVGGFAKGYVSKIIADTLVDMDVTFLLNTGNSNIITNGQHPLNEDGRFIIQLTRPSTDFQLISEGYQYLSIPEDVAVVTSGNYQRFFKDIETGDVYHHIISPITNYPGGDTMSVTIIYPDSALADIFSTAIFLLPLEDAIAYVNATEDLEAIWYDFDGTIHYSEGFGQYIYELEN